MNPRNVYMHYWPGSPLTQVKAWCLLGGKSLPELASTAPLVGMYIFRLKKKMDWKWYAKLWASCPGLHVLNMAMIYTTTTTIYIHQMDIRAIMWTEHQKKLHFVTHIKITIMQTYCMHGNSMCSRPIYWLGCLKQYFSIKLWYTTKWLHNSAIIYLSPCHYQSKQFYYVPVEYFTFSHPGFLTKNICHVPTRYYFIDGYMKYLYTCK